MAINSELFNDDFLAASLRKLADNDDAIGLRSLLSSGYSVNHRFENGMRPLHFASRKGALKLIRAMLEAGAIVEAPVNQARGSFTPLHSAVRSGNVDAVRLLIEYGAKTFSGTDRCGTTPLEYAKELEQHEIASVLLDEMSRTIKLYQSLMEELQPVNTTNRPKTTPELRH